MIVHGPGSPFELLFDGDQRDVGGRGLPKAFVELFRGDWVVPDADGVLYCYSNFVMSHDGRVSFAVPGHEGGGDVSGFDAHDQWLMGLLRARADAVVVGANTLRSEPEHVWTSQFIFPSDEAGFSELRRSEGRELTPLQVFVTRTGDVAHQAVAMQREDLTCVIITTEQGAQRIASLGLSRVEVVVAGVHDVDFAPAFDELRRRYKVSTVLCEGGPRVYGALVHSGVLHEEFLTLSPVIIGSDDEARRPGLIEGFALAPGSGRRANLISVRRASDHLFLRTAFES